MAEKSSNRSDPTESIWPRRPILLTLVLWVFVLWTVLGWLRFYNALTSRSLILELLPSWIFWYLVLAGLIWGLVGLPVIWGLVFRAGWARNLIPIAAVIYPLLYWAERLILWESLTGRSNWPFMLLLTMLWVGVIAWVWRSDKTRRFFEHSMKRKP